MRKKNLIKILIVAFCIGLFPFSSFSLAEEGNSSGIFFQEKEKEVLKFLETLKKENQGNVDNKIASFDITVDQKPRRFILIDEKLIEEISKTKKNGFKKEIEERVKSTNLIDDLSNCSRGSPIWDINNLYLRINSALLLYLHPGDDLTYAGDMLAIMLGHASISLLNSAYKKIFTYSSGKAKNEELYEKSLMNEIKIYFQDNASNGLILMPIRSEYFNKVKDLLNKNKSKLG